MRIDNRKNNQLRSVVITPHCNKHAEGSALIEWGDTKVICTVSVDEKVPPFLRGKGEGWVTAEYGMLPRSTHERMTREVTKGSAGGRTMEIQRLIGRSLRSIVNMKELGERTLQIDCDVIQADGGTRVASITGATVALYLALQKLSDKGVLKTFPVTDFVAAVSVGIIDGEPKLDLCYEEDSTAEVDMNVIMTGSGKLVEVQGTAEKEAFSRDQLNVMLDLAEKGIGQLIKLQRNIVMGNGKK